MRVIFPWGEEEITNIEGKTIESILQENSINILEFLIARNDEIIPEDTIPAEGDIIHLIRISHGG